MSSDQDSTRRSLLAVVATSPVAIAAVVLLVGLLVYAVVAISAWFGPYKEGAQASCTNYAPAGTNVVRAEWDWLPPEWRCVFENADGSVTNVSLTERYDGS